MSTIPKPDLSRFRPAAFAKALQARRAAFLLSPTDQEIEILRIILSIRDELLKDLAALKGLTDADKRLVMSEFAEWRKNQMLSAVSENLAAARPELIKQLTQGKGLAFTQGAADVARSLDGSGVEAAFNIIPDMALKNAIQHPVLGLPNDMQLQGTVARLEITVRQSMTRGLAEGSTYRDLEREIRDEFNLSAAQSMRIARTNINAAYNDGHLDTYQQNADIVEGKRWAATFDSRTSVICATLHGTVVKLGEKFPGGYDAPPAHPNCRSGIEPVFGDGDIDDQAVAGSRAAVEEYVDKDGTINARRVLIDSRVGYDDWLRKQPEHVRVQMLGSEFKAELFDKRRATMDDMLRNDMSKRSDAELRQIIQEREIERQAKTKALPSSDPQNQ